ncbi:MAG TPA: RusA family crossover junction endodeoxyribonuclease [Acidobacteriota bacterium]|nr:RusA family crossover junction endodeoxyribonuclease [Acidobacteriota bacterium]
MSEIRFWVPGIPRPGGSKKGFYIKKINRVVITEDNKKSKDWRTSVAWAAAEAIRTPLTGPLEVHFTFLLTRPKSHFGAKGLKASAPKYPTVKPDTTKLIRSTEDAMKGIAWIDDAQIARQYGEKIYTDHAGCWTIIRSLETQMPRRSDHISRKNRTDNKGGRDCLTS